MNDGLVERPTFTLPWKIGAVAVPLASLSAAFAFWTYQSTNYEHFISVYLGCLAGGTALLFAAATREIGRHFVAIVIGAALGAAALMLLSQLATIIIFLILLSATFLSWLMRIIKSPTTTVTDQPGPIIEVRRGIDKVRVVCTLLFGYVCLCVAAFYKPGQIFLAYPFVCGCLTMFFPGELSIAGRLRAWERGITTCFQGLLLGLCVVCALMMVVDLASKQMKLSPTRENDWLLLAIGLAFIPTHFYYERKVFLWISAVELGI
jgi:hypothetical protein